MLLAAGDGGGVSNSRVVRRFVPGNGEVAGAGDNQSPREDIPEEVPFGGRNAELQLFGHGLLN